MSLRVEIKTLDHFGDLELPKYETVLAAGADLRAALPADAPMVLKPGARALVPTGMAMALPAGYEAQIRPRSGLAYKHGITCLNTPGTIDADYRGEAINRGERIAQMVIAPITQPEFERVIELSDTARGTGGFGSTGVK